MRVMSVVLEQSEISFALYNEERNEITIETRTSNGYTTGAMVEKFTGSVSDNEARLRKFKKPEDYAQAPQPQFLLLYNLRHKH